MAIKLNISENQASQAITLDDASPYYVGARAYVTQNENGATITVIDKDGTTTATVLNGADGIDGYTPIKGVDYFDGTDGVDGQDGYTPIKGVDYFDGEDGQDGEDGEDGEDGVGIASITKTATVGLADTYTITYTNGATSTFNVTNGDTGDSGVYIGTTTPTNPDVNVWVDPSDTTLSIPAPSSPSSGDFLVYNGTAWVAQGEVGEVSYADLKSLLPMDTASGAIVSITDGQSVIPVDSLKVSLEPIQSGSGTPSPTNIRPISGHTEVDTHRTGKNLFDKNNITALDNVYLNTSNNTLANGGGNRGVIIPIMGGQAYTVSLQAKNVTDIQVATFSDIPTAGAVCIDKATAGSAATYKTVTITTSATAKYMFFKYNNINVTQTYTNQQVIDGIQIEVGSSVTSYEPYNGTTYTTPLGQTVYGGTLDVVSGELVVDRAMVDMGNLNWTKGNRNTADTGAIFYNRNYNEYKSQGAILSSAFETVTGLPSWEALGVGQCISAVGSYVVFCADYDSAASFKTAMSGVQLCYELATPTTVQLTPTEVKLLLGNNTIWSDGDAAIVYSADVGLYIDKKLGITEPAEGSDY